MIATVQLAPFSLFKVALTFSAIFMLVLARPMGGQLFHLFAAIFFYSEDIYFHFCSPILTLDKKGKKKKSILFGAVYLVRFFSLAGPGIF